MISREKKCTDLAKLFVFLGKFCNPTWVFDEA